MNLRLTRRSITAVLTFAAIFAMWLILFRMQFIHGDDYRHGYYAGAGPHGKLTILQLWNSYWYDWTEINGRMADVWVRAVVSWGQPAVRIVLPILLMVFTVVGAWFLPDRRKTWWSPAARMLATSTALMGWLLTVDKANGDVIYWVSGFMNYIVPSTLILVAAKLTARSVREPLTRTEIAVWIASVLVCGLLHEQTAFAMAALMGVRVLMSKFRVSALTWFVTIMSGLVFLWVYLSPGLRARRSWTAADQSRYVGTDFWKVMLWQRAVSVVAVQFLAMGLFVLLSALVVMVWKRFGRGWWITAMSGVALVGLSVAGYYSYTHLLGSRYTYPQDRLTGLHLVYLGAALVGLIGAIVIAWMLLWKCREIIGLVPFMAMSVGGAIAALNLGLGLNEGRPWFPAGIVIFLVAAYVCVFLFGADAKRLASISLLIASVGGISLHALYFVIAHKALSENWAMVAPLIDTLETAKDKKPAEIVMPHRSLPKRDWTCGVPFYLRYSEKAIRNYYEVPKSTKMVQK